MKWFWTVIVTLIALVILWFVLPAREWLNVSVQRIEALGSWAIVVYFVLYFCLASVAFPTTPLNVGAGLIFPFLTGVAVAWSAGLLAGFATFLYSRYMAREWAKKRLANFPQCGRVVEAVEEQGIKIVLLVRLNPLIPSSFKNFGFGVTSIPFWKFAVGTMLGQTPIVLVHVYLGWAGSATILSSSDEASPWQTAILVGGVILSIVLLLVVNWLGRRALAAES